MALLFSNIFQGAMGIGIQPVEGKKDEDCSRDGFMG